MIKLSAFMILIVLIVILASCDPAKPYINFTLKADKINDDCSQVSAEWTVDANTSGERYVFEYCLKDGFDETTATMDREGDTIVLHLPEAVTDNKAVYKLTLDLDAYPKYNHIQLGDRVIDVSVSGN
jgi:hypothetical protein